MATKKTKPAPKKPSSYRVVLTRLASNNAALRTPSVNGVTAMLPKVGKSFVMTGESLTKFPTIHGVNASFRLIETSEVLTVEAVAPVIVFTTRNSSYHLEVLPDEEEE